MASILDIRRNDITFSILDDMHRLLRPAASAEKRMPTLLLYDEKGLKLFEEITYLDEYYLTNAEIQVLTRYADHIADRIEHGAQLIELGSGYDAPMVFWLVDSAIRTNFVAGSLVTDECQQPP